MENRSCLVCGSSEKEVLFESTDRRYKLPGNSRSRFFLVKCLKCGFCFLDPLPKTNNELVKFYPPKYWLTKDTSFFGKIAQALFVLDKYHQVEKEKKRGRILDVGCGTGELLSYFQRRGWEAYGHDISNVACREARKKVRNIFCGPLSKADFPKGYFDVVILNHVLHQMINPVTELSLIRKFIKRNGRLIIYVPDIDSWQYKLVGRNWFYLDSPRHLYYFNYKTLDLMLKKAGFCIKRSYHPFWEFPLDLHHGFGDRIFLLPVSLTLRLFGKFRGALAAIANPI